mmetsp:Transcript_4748/g.5496  ORF Transcript_4748/g.5496 Transcript_4748/m.5496 type:complete len:339 (-) Transcript_4748:97-1113(-)|eukprot:CAMPEP_0198266720 /NCGR_PEP_ID=MMETSP1447-20131203/29720_1 /TAXON_ID=420782 /ORGANISM="Chaetoceros dichaeta, Strain CCMP1751" /LENGTH=338 /DNA_ID=CAMNT_0043956941 /DNA_START=41 /DNA_END=1057 /DNA_ORIENTATION=+
MSRDETYLESFIESISTLPSEIRRNLGHIKSLDKSYKSIVDELREREEDYLHRAQEIITRLPVQSAEPVNKRRKVVTRDSSEGEKAEGAGETPEGCDNENQEREVVDEDSDSGWMGKPKHGIPVNVQSGETVLVVPTTEELRAKIQDTAALVGIAKLRRDAKQYAEEKVAVADQTFAIVDAAVKMLEVDIEKFEGFLKSSGCFEISTGAQPDDLAAIQVTPNSPDWILAKVISHDTKTGMYKLSDEDIESNKTFTLPESQVVILGGVDRLAKGDIIYAVYPDTTSFYQATVVQAPRKVSAGESFVMVNFKDDGDENGITHDKAVLMKHIMRVPYGAIQ